MTKQTEDEKNLAKTELLHLKNETASFLKLRANLSGRKRPEA